MLNTLGNLVALILVLCFILWLTFKVGSGLGYWGPFVMAIIGTIGGLTCGIAKWAIKSRSDKDKE